MDTIHIYTAEEIERLSERQIIVSTYYMLACMYAGLTENSFVPLETPLEALYRKWIDEQES